MTDAALFCLADDLVSCGATPPLQPTMKGLLRALWLHGELSSSELYSLVPCADNTLRAQLSRLRAVGDVEGERRGRGPWVVYRLTVCGRLAVEQWHADVLRKVEALRAAGRRGSRDVD